jgi:hypothetical protein
MKFFLKKLSVNKYLLRVEETPPLEFVSPYLDNIINFQPDDSST